jgi:hypothetical protein
MKLHPILTAIAALGCLAGTALAQSPAPAAASSPVAAPPPTTTETKNVIPDIKARGKLIVGSA